jgi:hypothetical protein
MDIKEAKEAFIRCYNKVISQQLFGKITLDEQETLLKLCISGFDYKMFARDYAYKLAEDILDFLCDYVNGKTDINADEMIWFRQTPYTIILWKTKEN